MGVDDADTWVTKTDGFPPRKRDDAPATMSLSTNTMETARKTRMLKTLLTKTHTKMVAAITEVMRTNPWADGKGEWESRRMYHERIGRMFGVAVSVALNQPAETWAIYGGEDEFAWQYGIKVGGFEMVVNRNPPSPSDPPTDMTPDTA